MNMERARFRGVHNGRMVRLAPRGRPVAQPHTDLARAVSGAIGFYHTIAGIFLFLGLTKKWRILTQEMNKNQSFSFSDYESRLIRPFSFRIAANVMYFALGILLLSGVCKRSRHHCETWLICVATVDFFVIILGTEFEDPVYGVVWEAVKCICEISVVWSFTMDLRKEEVAVGPEPELQLQQQEGDLEPEVQFQSPRENHDENDNENEDFNLNDVFSPNEQREIVRVA